MLEVCHLHPAVFIESESFYALLAYVYSFTANIVAVRVKINYLLVRTMRS
jgi:hypothetical protein